MKSASSPTFSRAGEWILWSALALAVSGVLFAFRGEIGGAHVALSYLLIVLGASARGGRRLGFVLALLCFLAFNFLFIPPYYTFTIHRPLDWLVLFTFLVTSTVATQLLHRAQAEAEAARRRALEIERLAALGAETLNAGRAVDAVSAIARVIQSGLGVRASEIYLRERAGGPVRRIVRAVRSGAGAREPTVPAADNLDRAAAGLPLAEEPEGTWSVARVPELSSALAMLLEKRPRAVLIPLQAKYQAVGVLRIEGDPVVDLDPAQQRFAEALAYYAALAVERVLLTAEAEHVDALREADRLKDSLLASVSHDLRTPLTTIKALSHDLAAEGEERAGVIEQEADRLDRFVSDLLDLSRIGAGALSLTPELVAVEDLLGAALQQVSGAQAEREIRVALHPDEPLLVGRFDFVHTLRALVNLLTNALKYSPPGAVVELTARRDGGWVRFEVADQGPGVLPEDRERIFEPFYRGAGAPDVGGTGLGLTIARRMVEAQGGHLGYAPRSGGGSLFSILLPAPSAEELEAISL